MVQQYPDAVTIFLRAPSAAEFERRLRSRGTESEEVIQPQAGNGGTGAAAG